MRVDGQVEFPECQSRFVIRPQNIVSFFVSTSSFHHTYDDDDDDDDDDIYVSTIIR